MHECGGEIFIMGCRSVVVGVKSFYIFNSHFLSVNVFQGERGCR